LARVFRVRLGMVIDFGILTQTPDKSTGECPRWLLALKSSEC
jgi:hypothetical protein